MVIAGASADGGSRSDGIGLGAMGEPDMGDPVVLLLDVTESEEFERWSILVISCIHRRRGAVGRRKGGIRQLTDMPKRDGWWAWG
jgi:hypothetical protein